MLNLSEIDYTQMNLFYEIKKWWRWLRIKGFKAIFWTSSHVNYRNYMVLASIIIGIGAGLAAVVLKFAVNMIREWLFGNDPTSGKLGFVFFPIIGITLAILFYKYFLRKPLPLGFPPLIHRISKKKVNLPPSDMHAHIISSSLTVGFGGSVGLEAPIVRTGASIGSNLARLLQVGRSKQTLFLACGAAAGMAAIFNSPVAAVIFAFEVLLTDFALHAFIPLLISAATGAVVAKLLYYEKLFYLPAGDWAFDSLPFYILLGILAGLLSVYMIRITLGIQNYSLKIKKTIYKILFGGLSIGALIFLIPPLFGEGYETVNQLLRGEFESITQHSLFYNYSDNIWILILLAILIVFTKTIASAITMAIGGNGGIFAPSMISGAALGFAFAAIINETGIVELNESDFVAVAMAGILSGVIKSPLTGIFLIAEITGGYALFIPLMIVSALSYLVASFFEPHSVFTKELYQKGLWVPAHEKDRQILKNMSLDNYIEKNFSVLHPKQTLGELVQVIAQSSRNLFAVTNENGIFLGIILLDDVRETMFRTNLYDQFYVKQLMHNPPTTLLENESMEDVLSKFELHRAWNLPVLKADGTYLGFVSKSSIFNQYRSLLQASEDTF
jgi:CIC family chloride channel protein